jgi:hypothetical protein
MGKKSSDAPDVVGAAKMEGEFGIRQAQNEMFANRPDQFNYLGGVQWTPTHHWRASYPLDTRAEP